MAAIYVPEKLRAAAATQHGVVTADQAFAAGLSRSAVRTLQRRGDWKRMHNGAFLLDAHLYEPRDTVTELAAALVRHGADAFAVRHSAGLLHGISGISHVKPQIGLPPGQRRKQDPSINMHWMKVDDADLTLVDGLATTSVVRTLADLLLILPRDAAVSALDSALNQQLITVDDLGSVEFLMAKRRGVLRARKFLPLADGRAASPLETISRLRCVTGGVPPEELQWAVYSPTGQLLGYADLAWPSKGVIAEADGKAIHSSPEALYRDRHRQNDLSLSGLTILRFTWEDTRRRGYIASVVRRALANSTKLM